MTCINWWSVNPEITNVIHTCTCNIILQGDRISFSGQVKNYQNTVQQVVNLLGNEDQAANYLSRCIYSIGLGSNDYLNNYFQPLYYSTGRQYTPEQYADLLIQQYTQQLQVPASLRPFFFPIMNSQIIKYWWIVNEYVYNIGVVQLWGKEICVDWSGTDRVQPESIGSKQSRWENLCAESEWRKRNIQ